MALTPGADQVSTDPTHEEDVGYLLVQASTGLIPAKHRCIQVDASLGNINLTLDPAADSEKVTFLIQRFVTESNTITITPDGLDEINGVNAPITIDVLFGFIELRSDGAQWLIIADSSETSEFAKVVVTDINDLPAAISNVITLTNGVVYDWRNFISSADQLDLNGSIILGLSASIAGFTYTGSLDAIISTGESVNIQRLVVNSTGGGNVLNCTGAAGKNVNIETLVSFAAGKMININGPFDIVSIRQNQLENASVSGIVIAGAYDLISIRDSKFENNTLSNIDLTGVTSANIVNIIDVDMAVISGATGILNVAGSTNITEFLRLHVSNFRGAGTFVTSGMRCDSKVEFSGNIGNAGTEDSRPTGGFYITAANEATTLISAGVGDAGNPIPIAGTWTENAIDCKFETTVNGQFKYIGATTKSVGVEYKMLMVPDSGAGKEYVTHIRINGTTIDAQSRDKVITDAGNPSKIIGFTIIEFHTNDYIEIVQENITDETDVTAQAPSIILTG